MPGGGNSSVYETLKDHDNDLKEHRERITSLEDITLALKESDRQHDERLRQLEDNAVKLENTVMAENRDTRNTMKEQTDKMFVLVENAMNYQSTQTTQEHEIKKQEHELKKKEHELKMQKWNTVATVFLKVCGGVFTLLSSGGALYYVITNYYSK